MSFSDLTGAFKRPFAFALASVVALASFAPAVSAQNYTMSDTEYWAYAWAEQQTGSDIWADYQATNAGQSVSEYWASKSNKTAGEAINAVVNNVADNMPDGSAKQAVYDVSYRAGQTFDNLITDPVKTATYQAAKATKTFYDNGVTYWSVAGSEWWDSFYNDLFNNGGYKEQYVQGQGGNYTVNTTNGDINISFYGYTVGWGNTGNASSTGVFYNKLSLSYLTGQGYSTWYTAPNLSTTDGSTVNTYFSAWYRVEYNGDIAYIRQYSGGSPSAEWATALGNINVSYTTGNNSVLIKVSNGTEIYYINVLNATVQNVVDGSQPVLQPESVGVIHLSNGDIIPIYKDPSLNGDYVIQPNGTVTDSNGNIYNIYIDPSQLTPQGNYQIIYYITNNQPYSNYLPQNFNDSFQYDSSNGIFSGLGELLADLLGGLFGGLIDLIKAVIELLASIIKGLFGGSLFDLFGQKNLADIFKFGFFETLINLFFEVVGVEIV